MPNKPVGVGERYDMITIDLEGNVALEQHGYQGEDCKIASKALEDRLGEVTSRRKKDDDGSGGSYQATS